jgi:hypothetical protein
MKSKLSKLIYVLRLFGFDAGRILHLRNLPQFLRDFFKFKRLGDVHGLHPILFNYGEHAGIAGGAYFHHDLLVAQKIFKANPSKHIDVGSRIDGFVAHVAAFRAIEVLDIRPLDVGHENIKFKQIDFMESKLNDSTDSLSCLNALEHFGLGRYGDPIDPDGHKRGFRNLLRILSSGGILYLAVPVGEKSRVIFNAHRIFNARDVFEWSENNWVLEKFHYVNSEGSLEKNIDIMKFTTTDAMGCGIYEIRKL